MQCWTVRRPIRCPCTGTVLVWKIKTAMTIRGCPSPLRSWASSEEKYSSAQRIRYPLSGSIVSRDLVEGTIAWSDEKTMLSGTERLLPVGLQGPFDTEQMKEGVFLMQVVHRSWTRWMLREGWPSLLDLTFPGEQP